MPRFAAFLAALFALAASAFGTPDIPIRGLCIQAPNTGEVERFISLVDNELAPRGINLLVLRIDFDFEFESHPELVSDSPLTLDQVKQLVAMGKRNGIELIPQINLLGHQSWHSDLGKLLEVYPEFDETPDIELPDTYQWPNEDGLYCKSYCPLHPEVHEVVFALVDEIMDAFEAKAFHAGLDEVFYIGHEQCPRCAGRDKAELFAGEVSTIRNHLAEKDRTLWMWGDRLLDAQTTGLGIWEASDSGTHRAIDLIPKDVVICDWHYERAEATAAYFAIKGFSVLSCPWNKAEVAAEQLDQTIAFRQSSNPTLAERNKGILLTYWSSARRFMDLYENRETASERDLGPIESLEVLFPKP